MDCPAGTYPVGSAMVCSNCLTQCATCTSLAVCLSCVVPYYLYNSECITNCPLGYYAQPLLCTACQTPCLTCTSPTICQSCLSLSYFNSTCYSTCPQGYYSSVSSATLLNTTVKECIKCVSPCVNCLSSTSCMSCETGLKLHNYQCLSFCPQFYYDLNGICYACSLPCKTCNASGCLTCASSMQYLQRQECIDACTDLHPNNVTMVC